MKKILLSGIQPSGKPHIGNYFGAMKQFVDLQENYESNIFIADLHALTTVKDAKSLSQNILDVAVDYLTIGIDPQKTNIFKQSDAPQVTELAWIFNCITTMPYLMRANAYKDADQKAKEINVGLFDYPMLMAADILMPDADVVPVGQDQKQHVEYARDTAEKFNRTFGDTFKLPEAIILESVSIVPGLDGRKMSKSYGNTIGLFAEDAEIEKAVMSIPTDSKGVDEPKNPDENIVYKIHKILLSEEENTKLRAKYENGGMGYKEAKDMLITDLKKFIAPLREKRAKISSDKNAVLEMLKKGGERARARAEEKMKLVREKIGVSLY
jgi:tryptophanyl-tRNA synthetase